MIFEEDGMRAWATLHKALTKAVAGEPKGVVVQPLGVYERADWDTSNPYLNAFREQRLANQVPTWNPVYVPNAGMNVPDEYLAFLDRLNSKIISDSGVANASELKRIDDERSIAQDALQKNEYFINKQWDRYVANNKGNPPLGRLEWEKEFGFSAQRENLRKRVDLALAAYHRAVADAGPELLEIARGLSALSDPRQKQALPADELEANSKPENWSLYYKSTLEDDLLRFLEDESTFEVNIAEEEGRTDRFEERWSVSGRVSFFSFFGAGGSASNETIKKHTEQQTSRVKFTFKNLQSFPIARGVWFKGGLVSQFRDRMPPNFWGEGGRLNLIPTAVILGRGARIEVTSSHEVTDYFFNKRTVGGGGGFRIGPVGFGGRGSRTVIHENSSFDRTSTGFVIEDLSKRAHVIAVVSIRHADLLPSDEGVLSEVSRMNSDDVRKGMVMLRAARQPA